MTSFLVKDLGLPLTCICIPVSKFKYSLFAFSFILSRFFLISSVCFNTSGLCLGNPGS